MNGYPYDEETPKPEGPLCEVDGDNIDTYGGEHYWHCDRPGVLTVEGTLMCEDHAGERGYGPKQEEYGFDPDDGLNPTPEGERRHTIDGPHYDTVGHNPSLCWWEIPHCGPCWIRGEPKPPNPWATHREEKGVTDDRA